MDTKQDSLPLNDTYLTMDEVAKALRVSKATIWRWRVFKLPGMFRVGRKWLMRKGDLDDFINHKIQFDKG